ncbi:MAG: hypothetical protein LAT55_10270 [Opitutales bacterium]|nr:hypothetical protein [Opitutales bacterium]
MSDLENNLPSFWKSLSSEKRDKHYYQHILPQVIERIRDNQPDRDFSCDVLISSMGFSPTTTGLMTTLYQPRHLYVLTTADAEDHYNQLCRYLTDALGMSHSQINLVKVSDSDPASTYDEAFQRIKEKTGEVIVDMTGGKKFMGASLAQAAYENGAQVVYIDGKFIPEERRLTFGTESICFLVNPSRERFRQKREDAINAYHRRHFGRAIDLFQESLDCHADHHLEEVAIPLCKVYRALGDFDLESLPKVLEDFGKVVERPYLQSGLEKSEVLTFYRTLQKDPALESNETRIAVFMALAEGYAVQERIEFATLLCYRALELVVEMGLVRLAGPDFKMRNPDYTLLPMEKTVLEKKYIQLSREVDKKEQCEDRLPLRLGLLNGFALLCLLKEEMVRNYPPELKNVKSASQAFGWLKDIAKIRNDSILAHGTKRLEKNDYRKIRGAVWIQCQAQDWSLIQQESKKFALPKLAVDLFG